MLVWFYEFVFVWQESCKEDEALEPLLDAVRVLTVMLRKTEGESDKEPGNKKRKKDNTVGLTLFNLIWISGLIAAVDQS